MIYPELIDLVGEFFACDAERFNYDPPRVGGS